MQDVTATLTTGLDCLGIPPSPDLIDKFWVYIREMQKWSLRYRLVSDASSEVLVQEHILDSLLLVPEIRKEPASKAVDLGSGGGFPGLCISLVLPGLRVDLLDPRKERIEFLTMIIRLLTIKNCTTLAQRVRPDTIRSLPHLHQKYDLLFARGLSSLETIVQLGTPLLKERGRFILHRGTHAKTEVAQGADIFQKHHISVITITDSAEILPNTQFEPHKRFVVTLRKNH